MILALIMLAAGCVPGKQYRSAVTDLDSCKSELDYVARQADVCEDRRSSLANERDRLLGTNAVLVETNALLTLQGQTERLDASRATDTMKSRLLECEFHVSELDSTLSECRAELDQVQRESGAAEAPLDETLPAEDSTAVEPAETGQHEEAVEAHETAAAAPVAEPTVRPSDDGLLEALYSDIYVVLRSEIDAGGIALSIHDGALMVIVPSDMIFRVASSTIRDEGENILIRLSEAMRGYRELKLDVGAHTDNVRPSARLKKKYESNWELSAARAVSAVRYVSSALHANAWTISASAHADSVPVAPNDTNENRARNRRVEFKVKQ